MKIMYGAASATAAAGKNVLQGFFLIYIFFEFQKIAIC